jgi:lysophospholipase L1-like esterase
MLLVAALAFFPSLLPIPAAFKAFPELTTKPGRTLLTAVWPKANQAAPPTVAVLPDDPDKSVVLPELDFSGGGKSKVSRGLSYEDEREGQRWELVVKKVQAAHVDIDDPCLDPAHDGSCKRTALTAFFTALRAAREPTARAPVRVVVLGTSLIASDHITDVARRRLQARHGPGGFGYMYVDRPTRNSGRDVRCGKASDGWGIDKLTDQDLDKNLGLAGVAFIAPASDPQSVTFPANGQRLAEVFLATQPNGGELEIKIDGQVEAELSTSGDAVRPATSIIEIPEGSKKLELKTRAGPVRVDGVSLETGLPGIIFDSLGLPGGAAYVFLRSNEDVFGAQLLERRPALVMLMMGGNEAFDLSLNRYSIAEAKKNFEVLIERVRRYAPQASIMIASPPDAGVWRMDKTINARKETAIVSGFLHEVAKEKRVAIWDMQAAMGGEGAIERWWNAGLMNQDLVHPIGVGGDVFGYLLDMAMERARAKHEAKLMAARMQNRRAPPPRRFLSSVGGSGGVRGVGAGLKAASADAGTPAATTPAAGGLRASDIAASKRDGGHLPPRETPPAAPAGEPVAPEVSAVDAGTAEAGRAEPLRPDGGSADAGRPVPTHWPSGPGLSNPEGLTRFFERLKHLEHNKAGRVAILQIGASHTAAQHFTDTARSVLADRFGYAGRGYVAAGKAYERLERSGVERTLDGNWNLLDAMKVKTPGERWGLTGIRAVGKPGAVATFDFDEPRSGPDDSARVQVYALEEPGMGPLKIFLDQKLEKTLTPPPPETMSRARVIELGASGSKHNIRLENPGPGDVTVLGVSHELMRPGIVYDALGLPGSTAITFSHYDSETLIAQLKARQPDLYVLFYGTNESALPPAGLEQVRAAYPKIIANLRIAAPDAACVFLGPTDRMSKKKKANSWQETASIDMVYDILREVAARNDCAFWETREAMGGEGSIERWRKNKPPLANKDHVHLTHEGYRLLATEMVKDLLEAYDGWLKKPVARGAQP